MRIALAAGLAAVVAVPALALAAGPSSAQGEDDRDRMEQRALTRVPTDRDLQGGKLAHLRNEPSQVGISGCFMKTAPLFVTSGLDSVRVFDVSDADEPELVGVLPNVLFENEAMNCGERRTKSGTKRFALIGVDLVQSSPTDPTHVNVGGGELIVVDVTNPSRPRIQSRTEGSTSTHTLACVNEFDCDYAYSAGDSGDEVFSVFDLRNLSKPAEVDFDRSEAGLQAFPSPTAAHKWNFDAAGIGTHTGFEGASMWDTSNPRRPRLLATTGKAGAGEDPKFAGYNDFILHNSFRPNAKAFKANAAPSLANGNILLITEEDYEDVNCSTAGSFQTWWIKRLDGRPGGIVPLDKVELSDIGGFPLPVGGFCSAHWFDYRAPGLVAIGFYGGGTHILDVRKPREITSYGYSVWGASEVWDAMWVPVYEKGRQTGGRTNLVYAIDLVRGLDVYAVDVPGDGRGALPPAQASDLGYADRFAAGAGPMGLVGLASLAALGLAVTRRRRAVVAA